jgi:hypothetical protein
MVMNAMGHSDVRTAMRYQHPVLDPVRESLRHSDSAVTRRRYIKLQSHKHGAAAMRRLGDSIAKKAQTRPSKKRSRQ